MDLSRFTITLNPTDGEGRTIYRHGDRAYVAIPFGSRTPPGLPRPAPPSGAGSELLRVELPEAMKDPAFAACAGGMIRMTEDGAECRVIERAPADRAGEITARVLERRPRAVQTLVQLVDLRDDRSLLRGRCIDVGECHVQRCAAARPRGTAPATVPAVVTMSAVAVAVVPAPASVETTAATAPRLASRPESESAESECETHHEVLPFTNPGWRSRVAGLRGQS